MVTVEIQESLDGSATVWLIHKSGGTKKKTRLGVVHGPFFFKPVNVIFRNENSIGIEKRILKALKDYGVRWIVLRINNGWYPTPIFAWEKPDFVIRYRGEDQHHLRVPHIKVIADTWRDNYELLKKRLGGEKE